MKPVKKLNILIIEDNELSAKIFTYLLESSDCKVTRVENGLNALAQCIVAPYDLIWCDRNLPDINGYEITKKIRETIGFNQTTPIIGVTGHIFDEDKAKWLEIGANAVYLKQDMTGDYLDNVLITHCKRE
jgi:CheY-like chemotaxis protein